MLTAIGMACLLWLPPASCSTGDCGAPACATGCEQGCGGKKNLCTCRGWYQLVFTDCVCPLGTMVPDGVDYHGYLMRRAGVDPLSRRPKPEPVFSYTVPAGGYPMAGEVYSVPGASYPVGGAVSPW